MNKFSSILFFASLVLLFFSCEVESNEVTQHEQKIEVLGETDTLINPDVDTIGKHDHEDVLESIKKEYLIITEQLSKGILMSEVQSYNCPDYPEEGTITFFSDTAGVRIIEHQAIQGSHGGENTKYYLRNGELFFVYQVQSYWTFAESSDPEVPTTVDHVSEYRYYVHENEMIKCLEKNYVVKENEDFSEMSKTTSNSEFDCSTLIDVLEKFKTLKAQFGVKENTNCIWE